MRVYTLLILFILSSLFMCYGQEAEGFPKYVDTGDKEADALNFYHAKKAWILQNEAAYREMPETLKKSLFFDSSPYPQETGVVENRVPKCVNCEQPVLLSSKEIADKKSQAGNAIQVVEVVKDENWKSPEEWEAIKMREIEIQSILGEGGEEYKAKLKWILEHEEEYRKVFGDEEADKQIKEAQNLLRK